MSRRFDSVRLKQRKCSILDDLDTQGELDTDVDVAGHLDDLGELDGLLSGGLEVLDGEDLQAGLVDELVGLLHVGTLQTGDDGGAQVHLLDDVDETLGDGVAADDTTEDVDEDGGDLGVAGDQLEGALDGLGGGTTADVEEVSGGTAVQLDDVHGGHGETGTVDWECVSVAGSRIVGAGRLPRQPMSPSSLMKLRPCLQISISTHSCQIQSKEPTQRP